MVKSHLRNKNKGGIFWVNGVCCFTPLVKHGKVYCPYANKRGYNLNALYIFVSVQNIPPLFYGANALYIFLPVQCGKWGVLFYPLLFIGVKGGIF